MEDKDNEVKEEEDKMERKIDEFYDDVCCQCTEECNRLIAQCKKWQAYRRYSKNQ